MPTDDRRRKEGCISLSPPSAFLPSLQPVSILRYSNGDSSLPLYPFPFLAWLAVIGEKGRRKIGRKVSECGKKSVQVPRRETRNSNSFRRKTCFPASAHVRTYTQFYRQFLSANILLPLSSFFMNDSRGQAQKKVRGGRVGASRGKLLICRSQCLKRIFCVSEIFLGQGKEFD